MSGCFGNSAEDQYFERQLNRYLDNNVDSDDDSNESNNEPDYDAILDDLECAYDRKCNG